MQASRDLWGHPRGLYVCFATEMWERFSFYGMKYLLLLYLTKYHLFSDSAGYDVLGAYAGLVYALPLIGGTLADRYLGMRKAVMFGAILLTLGHATMAYEGSAAVHYQAGTALAQALTLNDGNVLPAGTVLQKDLVIQDTVALKVFFLALALITVGVGFLKANISTIVGRLYGENDPRRDSGFTIFYMGINLGSLLATLIVGYIGETYGWNYGFGLAGIGMCCGMVTFLWGQRFLEGQAEPPAPEKLKEKIFGPLNREGLIYTLALASLAIFWWLVQHEPVVHFTQNSLLMVAIVTLIMHSLFATGERKSGRDYPAWGLALCSLVFGIAWAFSGEDIWLGIMLAFFIAFIIYGFKTNGSKEYSRTVMLMFLICSSIVFWALFEQTAGSMTLYADRVLNRNVFGFEVRASQISSFNPLFIVVLGLPLAWLWTKLSKMEREPWTPVKFGLGILQAGLGFGALVIGAEHTDAAGKVAFIWMVLAYFLHTTGELFLSPVGLSAVTKLSIPRVVGASMGTWFLATALSETVATRLGKIAAINTSAAENADISTMLSIYTQLYTFLFWMGLGVGLFVLLVSPLIKKGMRGIH